METNEINTSKNICINEIAEEEIEIQNSIKSSKLFTGKKTLENHTIISRDLPGGNMEANKKPKISDQTNYNVKHIYEASKKPIINDMTCVNTKTIEDTKASMRSPLLEDNNLKCITPQLSDIKFANTNLTQAEIRYKINHCPSDEKTLYKTPHLYEDSSRAMLSDIASPKRGEKRAMIEPEDLMATTPNLNTKHSTDNDSDFIKYPRLDPLSARRKSLTITGAD